MGHNRIAMRKLHSNYLHGHFACSLSLSLSLCLRVRAPYKSIVFANFHRYVITADFIISLFHICMRSTTIFITNEDFAFI